MADQILNLPKVIMHGPPALSSVLQPSYSQNFRIINPSCLPLHQFIATHTHLCSSINAILCDVGYPVAADELRLLPSLRLVVTASAGTDHIDLSECRRRGIRVAGAGNLFSEDVADSAVALLIDVTMRISMAERSLKRRTRVASWDFPLASKLRGKKIGIVGLGSIGIRVAQRLEAFGCIISYNSRNKKPLVKYPFYSSVVELARNNNALVLCCALNDQTRHIIDREVMLALGKEGVIVNVARGAMIDEKELLRCLMEGEIGGAGLDVFENEPHVNQHFFFLDNVVLSPHVAYYTSESYMGLCQLVGQNLEAFFSNKPLVTPGLIYKFLSTFLCSATSLLPKLSHTKPFLSPSAPIHFHPDPPLLHAILCDSGYPVNADELRLLPSLRLVVTATVGTDHIDLPECRRRGVRVAGAGNLFSEDVADLAVALLIDVTMRISAADRCSRRRAPLAPSDFPLSSKLTGKKVGIVGLGSIGLRVAHRLEAFGCIISYNSRNKKPLVKYPFYSTLVELATNNNALVLCCALNDQTRHTINREVMLALGKEGVIVNVARGAVIEEKELLRCLMEGEIGGAGLDVFENEPLVNQHFFMLDNVVLSPHAGFSTSESFTGIAQLVGRNLEAFFSNKPLITPVI
ncbi:hypothetical protein RJT34_15394 [Clitoria ternatea]|uniref:glyoxylate reductase (NADP(+)) n=1 Tax=Clitoria ternatea TaxID=43366 RepID=A0AAN9J746_CLITE